MWPLLTKTRHDLALAKEVAKYMPEKPHEWEDRAKRLSEAYSTEVKQVELKGRGCRERKDRMLDKYEEENAKALKR